jgi:DNA-binding XRE family transcriptional regulator
MRIDTNKIKLLYTSHGFNQGELARTAGLSRQGLNTILQRGTCNPESLIKIAEALSVNPQELVKEV